MVCGFPAGAPLRAPTSVEVIRQGPVAYPVIDGHRLLWVICSARAEISPDLVAKVVVRLRAAAVAATGLGGSCPYHRCPQ